MIRLSNHWIQRGPIDSKLILLTAIKIAAMQTERCEHIDKITRLRELYVIIFNVENFEPVSNIMVILENILSDEI